MISAEGDLTSSVDLIVMGASARASAFSAIRAGFRPLCFDLFADADTAANAIVRKVSSDPQDLLKQLSELPRLPVIYTGGMENHPEVLEFAARHHELWGNGPDAVQRVRNPSLLQEAIRLAKISYPEWRPSENPPPPDGTWLLKPLAGVGGRGITVWTPEQSDSPTLNEPHFFQKIISGQPCSAVFIAPSAVGDVRFVGMTRQLVGEPDCHASQWQWCGNIGPIALPVALENLIRRFGNVLKWKTGLLGVYGVDLIITEEGVPFVTEVNPRYPASLEILEHATGQPLLADHCRCFTSTELPETGWNSAHPGEFMGKAIYFAPRDLVITEELADPASVSVTEFPVIADLPRPGTEIRKGEPVCTVFAETFSSEQTYELLKNELKELSVKLGVGSVRPR